MSNAFIQPTTRVHDRSDFDQLIEDAAHELCDLWGGSTHTPFGDESVDLLNTRAAMFAWYKCSQAMERALAKQNIETEIF